MTKQETYRAVTALCQEIGKTGVSQKLLYAAKKGHLTRAQNIYNCFVTENPELYKKIVKFGMKFDDQVDKNWKEVAIFDDQNYYNSERINPLDLFMLVAYGYIADGYLFRYPCNMNPWISAIASAGYPELANFIDQMDWVDMIGCDEDGEYEDPCELLIDIFQGEFS